MLLCKLPHWATKGVITRIKNIISWGLLGLGIILNNICNLFPNINVLRYLGWPICYLGFCLLIVFHWEKDDSLKEKISSILTMVLLGIGIILMEFSLPTIGIVISLIAFLIFGIPSWNKGKPLISIFWISFPCVEFFITVCLPLILN